MIALKIHMVTSQDDYSQTLTVLMYEIKIEDVYNDFGNDKAMFDFTNYSTKSKYYDNSNKLVVSKRKNETVVAVIEEFSGLQPKMYSYLVNDNS